MLSGNPKCAGGADCLVQIDSDSDSIVGRVVDRPQGGRVESVCVCVCVCARECVCV